MNKILKNWLSPRIPREYTQPNYEKDLNIFQKIRTFLVHWFFHPIKRRFAKYYCLLLQKVFGLKVVAITGSSGKSTTKEMLTSILKTKTKTVSSFKNIDPIYNIPTTILRCSPFTRYLVLEMGVEYLNEMNFYLWLVQPNVGVITSIYPTHTEFFKDIEGVYREKIKLATALKNSGIVVLNNECSFLRIFSKGRENIVSYGRNSNIYPSDISFSLKSTKYDLFYEGQKNRIEIPVVGKANVMNSIAALVVAKKLGFGWKEIKKGLKTFKPLEDRLDIFKKEEILVINDTYNSNPEALKEALNVFESFSRGKNKVLVIGDMLELGDLSKKLHLDIAKRIEKVDFDLLICVGRESKTIFDYFKKTGNKKPYFWVKGQGQVDNLLKSRLKNNSVILFKASHSIELDHVVKRLFK